MVCPRHSSIRDSLFIGDVCPVVFGDPGALETRTNENRHLYWNYLPGNLGMRSTHHPAGQGGGTPAMPDDLLRALHGGLDMVRSDQGRRGCRSISCTRDGLSLIAPTTMFAIETWWKQSSTSAGWLRSWRQTAAVTGTEFSDARRHVFCAVHGNQRDVRGRNSAAMFLQRGSDQTAAQAPWPEGHPLASTYKKLHLVLIRQQSVSLGLPQGCARKKSAGLASFDDLGAPGFTHPQLSPCPGPSVVLPDGATYPALYAPRCLSRTDPDVCLQHSTGRATTPRFELDDTRPSRVPAVDADEHTGTDLS